MKTVFLFIELLFFSSRAFALDGGGFPPASLNVYEHRNPAPVFTKSNNLKENSDHLAIGSTGRPNPKNLESQEYESWWRKIKTDPNATFAGIVAIFTFGLVCVGYLQFTQMKKTLEATLETARATLETADATRISGEATKLLAEATLNMESPIIIVQKAKMTKSGRETEEIFTSDLDNSPFIRIPVKNVGRTPAYLNNIFILLRVLKELPDPPDYFPVKFKVPNGMVLEPGCSNEIQQKYCHLESSTRLVLEGKMSLWAYGYIAYKDFIGREHKTGFCFRWYPPEPNRMDGRWEYEGPDSYLYMT